MQATNSTSSSSNYSPNGSRERDCFFSPAATLHVTDGPEPGNACTEEIPVTIEEPWSFEIEEWLLIRLSNAQKESQLHQTAGYRLKFKQRLLGFIVIVCATMVFIANSLVSCSDELANKIVMVCVSGINVFFSTLYSQLDMGKQSQLHFEYEAKFIELAEDIGYELARDRDFRIASDAFMTMVRERVKRLSAAPEYPKSRYFFC